jgi:radical SAM protein with 4Fe4S-binding SPASM domain
MAESADTLDMTGALEDGAPRPRTLQVEVTGSCNLRCPMCLVRYRPPLGRVSGSMTAARFAALLEELPDVRDVMLQGLGEPLLAPELLDMVRMAKARGVTVGFNSNGTMLSRDKAAALVEAGLDWLCISVDAATPGLYAAIRDGADLQRVGENVRALNEAKAERGTERPHLSLVMVVMRRNLDEIERVVRLAAAWGVPRVLVQNLSHSFDDAGPGYAEIRAFTAGEALWAGGRDRDALSRAFDAARRAAEESGVVLDLPRLDPRPPRRGAGQPGCERPWLDPYVGHDGTVQPCCMVMGNDRAAFGNAFEDGFATVWSGERARGFRAALLSDDPPDVCKGCALYHGVF